jgi:hypothetical protein
MHRVERTKMNHASRFLMIVDLQQMLSQQGRFLDRLLS